jgi:hypothetical protein
MVRSAIAKSGIAVSTRLTEELIPVWGDRVQLQQVALNLILNAVEAMGSVEAGARELLISTEQDHTGVLVAVRDPGRASIRRIWSAFSRRSAPRSPAASGWGCRSAGRSSTPMGAGCGRMRMNLAAPYFSSPCRRPKRTHEFSSIRFGPGPRDAGSVWFRRIRQDQRTAGICQVMRYDFCGTGRGRGRVAH